MEYETGVRMDAIIANQEKTLQALQYIVTALDDNNIKPKEVQTNGSKKSSNKNISKDESKDGPKEGT